MEELLPKCIVCKEKDCSFLRAKKAYSNFCGRVCARKHNMLINQKNSNSEEAKEKKRRTLLVKYGVENIFQTEKIKAKIKEKRGKIEKKRKQTNLQKYGVEYPSQNNNIKEKIETTNIVKYGVKSILSIPEIRNLGKGKAHSEEANEKRKLTNLDKYDVTYPSQSKEIQEKIKKTNLQKY